MQYIYCQKSPQVINIYKENIEENHNYLKNNVKIVSKMGETCFEKTRDTFF